MKNSLDVLDNRVEITQDRISELEGRLLKLTQFE